ncbi:MAG: hypothetical protein ACK56F_03630, partial [bacterium]
LTDAVDSANDKINYTVSVSNTGNEDLSGVKVYDAQFEFATNILVGGVAQTAQQEDGQWFVTIGSLNAGAAPVDITYTYTVQQEDINSDGGGDGLIENLATVDTDQTGPASDDANVSVVDLPGVAIDK